MSRPRPRSTHLPAHTRLRSVPARLLPGLAGALVLSTAAPVVAVADTGAERGTSTVEGSLQVTSATAWNTSGEFTLRNTGDAPADWTLRFSVPSGVFSNWAGWMSDTEQSDDVVTIRSRPDQRLAPGARVSLSFGIQGDGTAVPVVEQCAIDGADVAGCSAAEDDGDDESEHQDVQPPTAVGGLTATPGSPTSVDLAWTAATDDTGVTGYEVTRPGAEPVLLDGDTTGTTIHELPADTDLVFSVTARDAAGNRGPATDVTVRTPALPVEQPAALRVHTDRSEVPVEALGSAEAARIAEGRYRRHTELQVTGRYVERGDVLEVDVPEGVAGLELVTGLYGVHDGKNDGQDVGMRATALHTGTNRLTAERDGLVYLRTTTAQATQVEVRGGDPVATYVQGSTPLEEFRAQITEFNSAFVTLVGDRVQADFQAWKFRQTLKTLDVDARLAMWDDVLRTTDRVYGLSEQGEGSTAKAPHRLHVVNPTRVQDGWNASANHEYVKIPIRNGIAEKFLTGAVTDQWTFWHEVGHTYRPDWARWDAVSESSVNISALSRQESLGAPNRLDTAAMRKQLADFRKTPIGQRSFDDIESSFLKTLMFDQFRRAFGEDVYARATQQVRVDRAFGAPAPTTDDAKRTDFERIMAKATNRNLIPFFEEWGVPMTAEVREELAGYPALRERIWENHDRATDRVEHVVSYSPTLDGASITGEAWAAQRTLAEGADGRGARLVHEGAAEVGRTQLLTTGGTAAAAAEIIASDGTPNLVRAVLPAGRGSAVEFRGAGDLAMSGIGLDPSAQRLWVEKIRTTKADPSVDARYFGATLVDTDGTVIGSGYQKGTETSGAFHHRFDGTRYAQGQYLVLDHVRPERLVLWSDGEQLPASDDSERAFRIDGDALVPVALSEVPGR